MHGSPFTRSAARVLVTSWLTLGLILGLAGPAKAVTADEILGKFDKALNAGEDQTFEYLLIHQEPGKDPKQMVMVVQLKGELRMTEFVAPGDMKGTKALVRSGRQMYVYLPAYNKVRRVASHATEGGFFGTVITSEEMATTTYAPTFTPELSSETDKSWTLKLTAKPDADTSYGAIEVDIDKKHHLASQLRYFNKAGQHTKTEERTDYACQDSVCNFKELKMTDFTRGGAWTKLVQRKWAVNSGLSDSVFSVRKLSK